MKHLFEEKGADFAKSYSLEKRGSIELKVRELYSNTENIIAILWEKWW